MSSVSFRHCRSDDVEQALPLIISAGPESFHYVFCDRSNEQLTGFLRRAFARTGNEFSHNQHLALLDQGEIMGLGGLRYAHQTPGFTLAAMALIGRHYSPLAALRTAWRGLRAEAVIRPPAKGVAFIYQLAVKPGQQGRGYGRQLVSELTARAQQQGYRRVGLNVAQTNPRAQALYEALGFRVQREFQGGLSSPFGHVPTQRYMEKDL